MIGWRGEQSPNTVSFLGGGRVNALCNLASFITGQNWPTFGRSHRSPQSNDDFFNDDSETESFTLCPVHDGRAVPGALRNSGGNGCSLFGTGLICCLISVSLIRILALTVDIYRSDPDCPIDRQP